MPHVYKPVYTRPIPAGAERCTHKKKPAVRWKGRGGRVMIGVICEGNPGRCRVESAVWHIVYTDHAGREADEPGYADRAATEALLAERVRTAARVSAGLLPAEAASGRTAATLTELLEEFGRHLADGGATARHAKDRTLYARRVCESVGAVRPADLTPAAVIRAVASLAGELGLGRRTRHHHVSAVKQFTRWLCQTRKSEPADHLSGLACAADDAHPTFRRRALTAKEFETLLQKTRESVVVRRGLTGRERAALYLTAARTGLRASELYALTPAEFDLGARPVVIVRAKTAKNRRDDELPLRPDVVAEVGPILKRRKRGERVWPNRGPGPWYSWHVRAAEMIAADLQAAGLERETPEGIYDVHALRGQFATDLERAGVSLPKAQRLMRHSTPALTSKHYIRSTAADLADEVNKIGGPKPRVG